MQELCGMWCKVLFYLQKQIIFISACFLIKNRLITRLVVRCALLINFNKQHCSLYSVVVIFGGTTEMLHRTLLSTERDFVIHPMKKG